jgi:Alginate lyase
MLSVALKENTINLPEKYRVKLFSITDAVSPNSTGTPNEYFSEGDYWWPDEQSLTGLPYIQRDGLTNPDNFYAHRKLLIKMSLQVAEQTLLYQKTRKQEYAKQAVKALQYWFLNPETRMEPHLKYAQAIPGVCTGRGIGIIDTLHLAETALAIIRLKKLKALGVETENDLISWFSQYLSWLLTHKYGYEEKMQGNNHTSCWYLQVATFALLTNNQKVIEMCRNDYKHVLLQFQMSLNGSFSREIKRTKPYCYSIFNLETLTALCQILNLPEDNLFEYKTTDGLSLRNGIEFIYPYLLDKNSWPYGKDVAHWESWPNKQACLLFCALAYNEKKYLSLWEKEPARKRDFEAVRNTPVKNPELWLNIN